MKDDTQACAYIGDGYDQEFYIAAVPRLFPAVRFAARVMAGHEWQSFVSRMASFAEEEADEKASSEFGTRIQRWDIKDRQGRAIPVSPDTFKGLQSRLYQRMRNIVAGQEAGDIDPRTGTKPPTQEESEKNSPKG